MRSTLMIAGAALAALLSAVAASSMREDTPVSSEERAVEPTGYATLVADLDARIHDLQMRAETRPDDWLIRQHLGAALLERASLTQDFDDFAWLQHVLDEAFAIAPEGSGPVLLAARFELAIHRLDAAENWLDRIDRRPLRKRDDVIASTMLRAQIAMQRGDYETARADLTEVAAAAPAVANAELALYYAKTGVPEQADALLADAFERTPPRDARRRAWTLLQRGLVAMDRGMHLQALERLQQADAELSGWWLVKEHMAEVYDRLGEHTRAIAIYEELVREHGLPQHMDALALARKHAGEDAGELVQEASALWTDRVERFREAAIGHSLAHELEHGDAARALELAETNHALRPGGDAKVALARAYLAVARPKDALAIVDAALVTPYRTAALHRVAADVHTALGDTTAAAEELARCTAINPSCEAQLHVH